jgi:hypothetical protein
MTDIVFVASIVVTGRGDREVYLGVRRPVLTSSRHPGVLSTLTMSIPEPFFRAALAEFDHSDLPAVGEVLQSTATVERAVGEANGMGSPSVFLAESLLARKLEIGHLLVNGDLCGQLRLLGVASDVVNDPKGGGAAEHTMMATFGLTLTGGVALLPGSSSSYSRLAWVDGSALGEALAQNDALLLLPDADPFEVCIHGLCVRSAAELTNRSFGASP